VALVIGNSSYQYTSTLTNPKNDATDVSTALKEHGFQVIEGYNLDKFSFDRKVRDFAVALNGAEVGVFFYAGHGLQVAGQNFLVPVDAKAEGGEALDFEMVRVDVIHRAMERQTHTNILFLDACRDNPLARNLSRSMGTRSSDIGRGLAPVESGIGTLISFSTQPGNVALDGTGRNSPFAGALVRHISRSDRDLGAILIAVRNDVMKETQRKQVPWEHSALTGQFYFHPSAQRPSPLTAIAPPANDTSREWLGIDKTSIAELETFVRRHGSSPEADYARARIKELGGQPATAATPAVAVSAYPLSSSFDGTSWKVVTTAEKCQVKSWTTEFTVKGSDIFVGPDFRGRIQSDGAFEFSVPNAVLPGTTMRYTGKLKERAGSGGFSVQPAYRSPCGGSLALTRSGGPDTGQVAPTPGPDLSTLELLLQDAPATDLFRDGDLKRVVAIAEKKQLPLPPFRMRKPADDVPAQIRRFVGIWVSDPGWESGRQGMLIVANADHQGRAVGYHVTGPPTPTSFAKIPASYNRFTGEIVGDTLSIVWSRSTFRVRLSKDRIDITEALKDGRVAIGVYKRFWTLTEAERVAKR